MRHRTRALRGNCLLISVTLICWILRWTDASAATNDGAATHQEVVREAGPLTALLHNHLRRRLAIGDFDDFNNLLKDLDLPLPPTTVDVDVVGGTTLKLDLANIICSNLNIGDIVVEWIDTTSSVPETLVLQAKITLVQVDLDCRMDYDYSYLVVFNGGGVANLQTEDSQATLAAQVSIPTSNGGTQLDSSRSIAIEMLPCQSQVLIENLVLDGDGLGLVARAVTALQFAIKDTVASEIEAVLCVEIGNLEQPLQSWFEGFLELLRPYLEGMDKPTTDPLEAESLLMQNANGVELLNFRNPQETTVGTLVDLLLTQLSSYIGQKVLDESRGRQDLVVNELIRSWLPEDGSIVVDLTELDGDVLSGGVLFDESHLLGSAALRITSVRVYGFDTFRRLDPLVPIGLYTLETSWELEDINISLQLQMDLSDPGDQKSYSEDFQVDLALSDVGGSIAVLLGVDALALGRLPLGALMRQDHLANCVLSSLYDVGVTGLSISPLVLDSIEVSGLESPGLRRVLSDGIEEVASSLGPLLSLAIPQFVELVGLDLLRSPLELLGNSSDCRVGLMDVDDDGLVDFRDLLLPPEKASAFGATGSQPYGELASFLKGFIDDEFLSFQSTGLPGLSERIIAPLTEAQSGEKGTLSFEEELLDLGGRLNIGGLDARFVLKVGNVSIDNLHSVGYPLFVLEPVAGRASVLNNTATLGVPAGGPLRLAASILLEVTTDEESIRNQVDITVEMASMNILATVLVIMSSNRLLSFPIEDILNLHCWLSTIPAPALNEQGIRSSGSSVTLGLTELDLSVSDVNVTVDCVACSGPLFEELSQALASQGAGEDVLVGVQNVLDFAVSQATGDRSFLQTEIDRQLAMGPMRCPHRNEYDPNAPVPQYAQLLVNESTQNSITFLLAMLVAMVGIVVSFIVVAAFVKWIVAGRNRKWIASLSDETALAIYRNQTLEKERNRAMDNASRSMFLSKQLPLFVRFFVPIVLLGNIALFLSGHLSKGGEVRIYVQFGGEEIVVDDFYSFSIAQSGIELWNAGAKSLAILLLLFSGVWPYLKQLVTLALWFVPPRIVSLSRRGLILLWLDALAKWSMIDVFVMIITIAPFRVTIESPSGLLTDLYQVDLLVVPVWGLYANMCAQLLSQVTSHVIISYHRRLVKTCQEVVEQRTEDDCDSRKEPVDKPEGGVECIAQVDLEDHATEAGEADEDKSLGEDTRERLCGHAFSRPHRGEAEPLHVRPAVNPGFIAVSFATVALVIVGCALPSFSYDYRGLVGVAVESGMNFREAREEHSVISLVRLLMDQARFLDTSKDYVGLGSVAVLLILTTIVIPVAQCLVLVCEWFLLMPLAVANNVRVAIEILQAWQYVEVFLLSVIVGAWQIGDVSEFLVNSYCESLEGFFGLLTYYEILKVEDAQCFRVQASVEYASYILIAASVLLLLITIFVKKAAFQRSRDKAPSGVFVVTSSSIDGDGAILKREKITPVPVLFSDQFRWLLST